MLKISLTAGGASVATIRYMLPFACVEHGPLCGNERCRPCRSKSTRHAQHHQHASTAEPSKKILAKRNIFGYLSLRAEVVELVDTLGSGSSSRKGVGVRVSPSAPSKNPIKSRKVQKALRDLAFWAMVCPARCRGKRGEPTKMTVFAAV